MHFERTSGILLHVTSLPSLGGIGDLGPAAHQFVEWLHNAGQRLWQVLPLAPVGYGESPYSAISAFAGNPLLISLERLVDKGWLAPDRLKHLPGTDGNVDFKVVKAAKLPLLREAAANFLQRANGTAGERFEKWKWENGWWQEDFVLFELLRERYEGAWNTWPHAIAHRDADTIKKLVAENEHELELKRVIQFFFYEQWHALRQRCAAYGIKVVGDVAIFVSYDSADVWTHPEVFRLDPETLEPEVVAGVPPDAFSETGQRWGNPLYRWSELKARGYDWWIKRLRWALITCDIIRLDHFRGFEAYWEIPGKEPTAINGRWVKGPGDDLFSAVEAECGSLPFIAEDLGMITKEVHDMRERIGVPGMRVLQFGFSDRGAHIYLPHQYEPDTVVYTGTHDNDTTVGWWKRTATEKERRHAAAYLGEAVDGMHWQMIRAAEASVAELCIIPLQDVLGLDSDARMNVPSKVEGNWSWRYLPNALTPELAVKMAQIADVADRLPINPSDDVGTSESVADEQSNREVAEQFSA